MADGETVEIHKPDGGVRKLGIPTALDRFVQQAMMQVLHRRWDQTFSDSSYGFRPGGLRRSNGTAIAIGGQYQFAISSTEIYTP